MMWVHPFGKQRDEPSIKSVGLGELPGGFHEIADLTRIRHDDWEGRGGQCRDERSFISASVRVSRSRYACTWSSLSNRWRL